MLTVNTKDKTYVLGFQHINPPQYKQGHRMSGYIKDIVDSQQRKTVAVICEMSEDKFTMPDGGKLSNEVTTWPNVLGAGVALVHPTDNYCKKKGRKYALARAMRDAGMGAGLRRDIWESYFKAIGGY